MSECGPSREDLVRALSGVLAPSDRDLLALLPDPELRYLSVRPDLQARYASGERGRFLFEWEMSAVERGKAVAAEIEASTGAQLRGCRTLDVGCGDGGFLVAFAARGAYAHGLDLAPTNVAGATLRARAWRVDTVPTLGSATATPYRSGTFTIATCGDVIEHIPGPRDVFGELARVLRPGGILWLSSPTRFLLRNLRADPHFGCLGVAVLSRALAAWYLTRIRRKLKTTADYDVETLPTYASVMRHLRAAGFEVVVGGYSHLRDPRYVRSDWKRRILQAARKIRLDSPVALVSLLMTELLLPMRLICRKVG